MEITYPAHQSSMAKLLSQVRETTGLISDSAQHADNTDYPERKYIIISRVQQPQRTRSYTAVQQISTLELQV